MDNKRFSENPFNPLILSSEERAKLVALLDEMILAKFSEYEEYVHNEKKIDLSRWKSFSRYGMTTTYLERKKSNSESKLLSSLMVGALPGTLDDNMFGLVSPTLEDMRIKASYLHDFSAAALLATIIEPSFDDPFRTVVVKWIEIDIPGASTRLIHNRDYVFVEASGILCLKNGERVGYHIYHSVNFPQTPDLPHRVRGNMSFSCIFRQENDRTDCRGTGFMDPGGDMIRTMAVMGMVQATMAGSKYSYCGQMKKLTWLVEQNHKKEQVAHASTSVCKTCLKRIKTSRLIVSKAFSLCRSCFGTLCGTCTITKKLTFVTVEHELTQRKVPFCVQCIVDASHMDTLDAARQQFVYRRCVQSSVLGSSLASNVSSNS
ncbi:putative START-like domain superfamily protein [Plasmopara halstedii]